MRAIASMRKAIIAAVGAATLLRLLFYDLRCVPTYEQAEQHNSLTSLARDDAAAHLKQL